MRDCKTVRIGKCQNWKGSELESVKIGECQNWKVSEYGSVKIGECQNWEIVRIAQNWKCQNPSSLENVII